MRSETESQCPKRWQFSTWAIIKHSRRAVPWTRKEMEKIMTKRQKNDEDTKCLLTRPALPGSGNMIKEKHIEDRPDIINNKSQFKIITTTILYPRRNTIEMDERGSTQKMNYHTSKYRWHGYEEHVLNNCTIWWQKGDDKTKNWRLTKSQLVEDVSTHYRANTFSLQEEQQQR